MGKSRQCFMGNHEKCKPNCGCECHTYFVRSPSTEPAPTPESEPPREIGIAGVERLAQKRRDLQAGYDVHPYINVLLDELFALLRSQARELAIRDAEITEWDTLTTTQIREIAQLSRELEEAKRPIPREGERIVLTWLDAMHAKYPASEYGMAAVLVRSLSRQLEEASTENERLRGIVKLYARHTEECRGDDFMPCVCGLSGLLEVSG